MNNNYKNKFLSDTIKERPLPTPPIEDTLNSNFNLSKKENFRSEKKQLDKLFDNKTDSNFFINNSNVDNNEKKEENNSHLNNITYLLAKLIEKVEILDRKSDNINKKVDNLEKKIENKFLKKTIGEANSEFDSEIEIVKKQNLGLKMDKDILLKLIKKMVDQNSDNIPIINEEFYASNPQYQQN